MIINGVDGNSIYETVINLVCGYAAPFGEKSEKKCDRKKLFTFIINLESYK